jgi:hypothetical protein
MSKFTLTINDDGSAHITVNGKEHTKVRRLFIYGEPTQIVINLEEYVMREDGRYAFDESGERLLMESRIIEVERGQGYTYEASERTVEENDC